MKLSKRLTADLIWCAKQNGKSINQVYSLTISEARQILDALKIKYTIKPNK